MSDDAGGADKQERTVPYERFQAVVTARRELEGQIEQLKAELQQAAERAATADTLASQIADMKAGHAKAEAAWGQERAMMSAGLLDQEARVVAMALHAAMPDSDRPELGDWLGTLKADPDKAPAALRPYFSHAEQTSGEPKPPKGDKPPGGQPSRKQPGSPPAGATASVEAIRAAKLHGQRTGDWKRFNELTQALAAERDAR